MDAAAQITRAGEVRGPGGLLAPSRVAAISAVIVWGAELIHIAQPESLGGATTPVRGRISVPRAGVVGDR